MTGGEIAITASIAFLSVSAPATAAIFARSRRSESKPVDLNGKYVQTREYDQFKADLDKRLGRMESEQSEMFDFIRKRL